MKFEDFKEILVEYGGMNRKYLEFKEKEILKDKWLKHLKLLSQLENEKYQISFYSKLDKNNVLNANVKKIMGKVPFSTKVYRQDSLITRMAKRALSERGLEFLWQNDTYRVGKKFKKSKDQIIDEETEKQQLIKTIDSVILTQSQLKYAEGKIEEKLYEIFLGENFY